RVGSSWKGRQRTSASTSGTMARAASRRLRPRKHHGQTTSDTTSIVIFLAAMVQSPCRNRRLGLPLNTHHILGGCRANYTDVKARSLFCAPPCRQLITVERSLLRMFDAVPPGHPLIGQVVERNVIVAGDKHTIKRADRTDEICTGPCGQ